MGFGLDDIVALLRITLSPFSAAFSKPERRNVKMFSDGQAVISSIIPANAGILVHTEIVQNEADDGLKREGFSWNADMQYLKVL